MRNLRAIRAPIGRPPRPRRVRGLVALIVATGALGAAIAQPGDDDAAAHDDAAHLMHTHEPLIPDPDLTLEEVIEITLARHPTIAAIDARRSESGALTGAARRWFSAAPALVFSHLNDDPLDARGQQEYQAGIELSLWRAGQKTAARELATSASAQAGAAADLLRWEIAGMLRTTLWDIAGAENSLALARDAVDIAREVVRVVERRIEVGDLPESDGLLARSALLEKEIAAIDREAELLDAERVYRSLTGIDERPVRFGEPRAERDDFDETHPALAFAEAEIERARANRDLTAKSSRGSPSLAIIPRRQRDPLTAYYNNSVALEFRLPVGGERYGAPQRASASRAVAEAQSRQGLLLRELDLALHEAEHELSVVEQSLDVVARRAALAERQWTTGQAAFELGEIELRDLLRLQENLLTARTDVARFEIRQQRTVAMMNQALGELP